MDFRFFFFAFLVNVILLGIASSQYQKIVRTMGGLISFMQAVTITSIAYTLNSFLPLKASTIIVKPYFTKKMSTLSLRNSLSATFFEQTYTFFWNVFLLLGMMLLMGETIFFRSIYRLPLIFGLIVIFILFYLLLAHSQYILKFIQKIAPFLPLKLRSFIRRKGITPETSHLFLQSITKLFKSRLLMLQMVPLLLLTIILGPIAIHFILLFFEVYLPFFDVFLAYWISSLVGRFSFLPGIFSLREIGLGAYFILLGVPALQAISIVAVCKLISMVPSGLVTINYILKTGSFYLFRKEKLNAAMQEMKKEEGL